MSFCARIDNKKKDTLVLGKNQHALTAQKIDTINFTVTKKKLRLNLRYNAANSYLLVNGTEIYKFKSNDSEIVASPLCLGNISKDFSRDMKKPGFHGYVYDFSVDYDATDVD